MIINKKIILDAIAYRNEECLDLLLNNANIDSYSHNVRLSMFKSILHKFSYAYVYTVQDIVKYISLLKLDLNKFSHKETILFSLCGGYIGQPPGFTKWLLEQKEYPLDIYKGNRQGMFPFTAYICRNRINECDGDEVIQAFINAGMDINKTDENGNTVLLQMFQYSFYWWVTTENIISKVKLLMSLGADLNVTNKEGKNIMGLTKGTENEKEVKELVAKYSNGL